MIHGWKKLTAIEKILHHTDHIWTNNVPIFFIEQYWRTIRTRSLIQAHRFNHIMNFLQGRNRIQRKRFSLSNDWRYKISQIKWERWIRGAEKLFKICRDGVADILPTSGPRKIIQLERDNRFTIPTNTRRCVKNFCIQILRHQPFHSKVLSPQLTD